MSVIDQIRNAKKTLFTFELLPPLKGASLERVYNAIDNLVEFEPAYINFTSHRDEVQYSEGPDGTFIRKTLRKRPGTIAMAAAVKYKYNINVVPHLLCGGFSREETENALIEMNFLGIDDVLALRGDPPRGSRLFIPEADGHSYTSELVEQIADLNNGKYLDGKPGRDTGTSFCIGVAGYPEKHLEAPNMATDLANLKRKVDAGASYIVTQMFFSNDHFHAFVKSCREMGITVPIIPGIKPVTALNDIKLLPQTFNIDLPDDLVKELMKCKTDDDAREAGIEWGIMQTKDLIRSGVPGIHYYTLGRSDNVARIVKGGY